MTTKPKNFKIGKKDWHLKNATSGQFITVFPPAYPGDSPDEKSSKNKKTKAGEWRRTFRIVDTHGVKDFDGQESIVLTHLPREAPKCVVNGDTWMLTQVEKQPVNATKATKAPAVAKKEEPKAEVSEPEKKEEPAPIKAKTMMEDIEAGIRNAGKPAVARAAKLKTPLKKTKNMKAKAASKKH